MPEYMPALGEREIARFTFRLGLFLRRGVPAERAEHLCDRLARRDHERDDRRMCLECSHLQRSGGCFAAGQGWIHGAERRLTPVPDLLGRCEQFAFQTPK